VVVAYEGHAAAAGARVPAPGEVAVALSVEPGHDHVVEGVVAAVGAGLGHEDRHLRREPSGLRVVARAAAANVEVVKMPARGSVKSSRRTAVLPLKVFATCDRHVGEWSWSGIGTCWVACCEPGAVQCRSRIA